MTVAVYGREQCVQCHYTCEHLERRGIPYEYFDIDRDSVARATVKNEPDHTLPLVIVTDGHMKVIDRWHGFKIDKIRGLHT